MVISQHSESGVILVTGGTGTVGSHLVELLAGRGQRVRVLCRDASRARARFGDRVEVAEGDFDEPDSVDAALAGADQVFLLTAGTAEPGSQLRHERTVIGAAERAGASRVVKLSVLGAARRSPIWYLRSHHAAEQALRASGLGHTILRPAGFLQNLFEWAADGSIHTCAGDGRSALVDVRDIAEVAASVLTEDGHLGRTYTLTGPRAVSYDEVAAALSNATGRRIAHVRVSPEALVAALTSHGLPPWLAQDLAVQFQIYATNAEVGRVGEVSDDVAAVTGRPARSLDDFAREEFTAGASEPRQETAR